MANEIRINSAIQVKNGNLDSRSSNPTGFTTDQTTARGPSPGTVIATTGGVDVSFAQLVQPGWCRFTNLSSVAGNYVEVGIYDGDDFWPLFEVGPGEVGGPIKISRRYDEGGVGSGTATASTLRIVAALSDAPVNVECYDS